jgi:hypothetical protein
MAKMGQFLVAIDTVFEAATDMLPDTCLEALDPQNDIEQGAALQAQCARARPQRTKVQEAEVPPDRSRYATVALVLGVVGLRVVCGSFELVLFLIVPGDSQEAEAPHPAPSIHFSQAALAERGACPGVPAFEVVETGALDSWGDADEKNFDADRSRLLVLIEVGGVVEVKLLDDREACLSIRAKPKFKRLEDGRLPDVVLADQQRVALEVDRSLADAPEVLDRQTSNVHGAKIDESGRMGSPVLGALRRSRASGGRRFSEMGPSRARRAVPSPRAACLGVLLGSGAAMLPARVVVPADRLELPDGCDTCQHREVAFAADLGTRHSTGVADDPDVAGLHKN